MAPSRSMVTTPVVTATGTLKRTVADKIRRLNPAATPFLSIVKTSSVNDMGDLSTSEGLIRKEATDTMKFEWFTYVPIDLYNTATGDGVTCTVGQETGTAVIADTSAFRTRDIVTNLRTLEVAVVNAVTSGTVLTLTAVGDGWSCTTGDVIAMSCRTVEEGTSDITPLTKEPDNNYNYVFPFRYSVSLADTAINSPHYGGDLLTRYMADNLTFTLRNVENALFLGKRAASETTTVTIGGTAYAMYLSRGILDYSTAPIDAGGTMTFDKWSTTVYESLPRTHNPKKLLVMPCSRKILGRMNSWATQKLIERDSGEKDEFGVRITDFYCGGFTVRPMVHDLFDQGPLQSIAPIFDPADFTFMYKKGLDIQPKDNLQLPATWGKTKAVQGVVGLRCMSGGANVRTIINWDN